MSKTKIPCSELPWGQIPSPSFRAQQSLLLFSVPCRNVSWDESEQDFQAVALLHLAPTKQQAKMPAAGASQLLSYT